MKKRHQPGFTVLELTFAIIVIGVMMAIVLSTIVGMLRFYNFASVVRINQAAGRRVMDDMDRQIRFSTIIIPADGVPQNQICVADTKNQKLYQYRQSAQAIQKSVFSYTGANLPVNCAAGANVSLDSQGNITPASMSITGITFTRTAGARITLPNQNAASVVIDMKFINGSYDHTTNQCVAGDIYCSALEFVTAVNIRQGGR